MPGGRTMHLREDDIHKMLDEDEGFGIAVAHVELPYRHRLAWNPKGGPALAGPNKLVYVRQGDTVTVMRAS